MIDQGSALDRALHHDDMNAARELLEEIGERGRQQFYTFALFLEVIPESARWDITLEDQPGGYIDRSNVFVLLNATPEQHARAFIAATQAP